jgi:hypothetical protein
MSETYTKKPPILFWILAIAFILWGLMGCGMYLAEMMMSDEAYAEAFGADLAAVRDVYPTWGLAGYATAVWSGLLASILFILRKRISVPIYVLSLIAAIIGFFPSFTNSVLRDAAGAGFWIMPLVVVVLGLIEILYSSKQRANGILR